MAVVKDEEKKPDEPKPDEPKQEAKKAGGPSLAKVVAALARNTTFTQHQPEDAELVTEWLANQ